MEQELTNGVSRTVELVFPYMSGYRPFLAIHDSRGVRVLSGGNAVRAEVFGSDYAVIKGYLVGSRPYILDVVVGGDGVKFIPALLNSMLLNGVKGGASGGVTMYMLEFKLPKDDVGLSVKFHKEVRRCFYRISHTWVGYGVCFDINRWVNELSRYGDAYVRIYPITLSLNDALKIVDNVIERLRGRIKELSEDLKYELRAYRRARLSKLIGELNEILKGWESFRARLVIGNGGKDAK